MARALLWNPTTTKALDMARALLWNPTTTKALASHLCRSFSTKPSSPSLSLLFLNRVRPLSAVNVGRFGCIGGSTVRGLATRAATANLNDSSTNRSNRPPKETVLLDGCDFEHWLIVMEKPEGDPTRDEIIDSYIKTLAKVVGSEEEARMKIYSVSTRCYFAFGALVNEETSNKLKELPGVRWVLPDSYLDVRNKDYGGEPFINGQAVPYDPKYHEEWIRNNARANERNRRNDRPRTFDRSRNFERRRENMQNRDFQNQGMQNPVPNMSSMPPNTMAPNSNVPPQNVGGAPQSNYDGRPPASNYGGPPPPPNNYGGPPPPPPNNYGGPPSPPPSNYGGPPPPPPSNYGGPPPPPNNYGGSPPPPNNYGGSSSPPNHYGRAQPPPNYGGRSPSPSFNSGNMSGMPPNAGSSGNMPGNVQQTADDYGYQNSYTPRQ